MVNFAYTSGNNTYLPQFSPEASNALIVSYSRDPKRFGVNRYTQVVKVETQTGKYIRLNPYDASRVLDTTGAASDIIWQDGADRPINSDQSFSYPLYLTTRKSLGFHIGDLAQQQAAWDVLAAKSQTAASRMMTYVTVSALQAISNATNASTSSAGGTQLPTDNAIDLGGGYWNAGTNTSASSAYFRLGVTNVLSQIMQNTNSVVDPSEIFMIVNPKTARLLAASVETIDTVKQSPFALGFLENDKTFPAWGLPQNLFGLGGIIVESAVYTTTNPNSSGTGTPSFVMPDNYAYFVSRPGAIEGQMGSYSTVQGFFKEELVVESWDDPINRRQVGSITSDFCHLVAAPASGYVASHLFS